MTSNISLHKVTERSFSALFSYEVSPIQRFYPNSLISNQPKEFLRLLSDLSRRAKHVGEILLWGRQSGV